MVTASRKHKNTSNRVTTTIQEQMRSNVKIWCICIVCEVVFSATANQVSNTVFI